MAIGRFTTVASRLPFSPGLFYPKNSQYQKLINLCPRCANLFFSPSVQFSLTSTPQSGLELMTAKDIKGFYGNPIMKMQSYLQVPILPDHEICFNPLLQEMKKAEKLFTSFKSNQIHFLKSVLNTEDLPTTDLPEVAFLGRSNVGKSSLIQALFHQSPEVKVKISSKPGHTKLLNFFQVRNKFFLVDMPGYGYNMPLHFVDSVEAYLKSRRMLCRTFLLLDSEIGLTKADQIALEMFDEFKIPFVLVFTKIDKVNPHIQLKKFLSILKIRDQFSHCCLPQPFCVSSKTGDGIPLLQAFIGYATGNLKIEEH